MADVAASPAEDPFHHLLRTAIHARGLSLSSLRDHLAQRGQHVSISTLSCWQRGVTRPPASRATVLTALDQLLKLPAGTLARYGTTPPKPRRRQLGIGTSRSLARRLKQLIGGPSLDVCVVSVQTAVTVGTEVTSHDRLVLRAIEADAERLVVSHHCAGTGVPAIAAISGITIGRTACDELAGQLAAELRFAPLAVGETYPIEYGYHAPNDVPYFGRWIQPGCRRFEITGRFLPSARVRGVHSIWRLDPHSPHKDQRTLRLIGGQWVHLELVDPSPGFYGIRWE